MLDHLMRVVDGAIQADHTAEQLSYLTTQAETLKIEINDLKRDGIELQATIELLEHKNATLKSALAETKEFARVEGSNLRRQLQDQSNLLVDERDRNTRLQEEITQFRKELIASIGQIQEMRALFDSKILVLTNENLSLRDQITQSIQTIGRFEVRSHLAEEMREQTSKSLGAAILRIESLQDQLDRTKAFGEVKMQELERVETRLAVADQVKQEALDTIQTYQAQLTLMGDEAIRRITELNQTKALLAWARWGGEVALVLKKIRDQIHPNTQ
jgi:chromosome segregation ATPase